MYYHSVCQSCTFGYDFSPKGKTCKCSSPIPSASVKERQLATGYCDCFKCSKCGSEILMYHSKKKGFMCIACYSVPKLIKDLKKEISARGS